MENLQETRNPNDLMLNGVQTTRLCIDTSDKIQSITLKDKTGKILEIKAGSYADDLAVFTNRKEEKEKEEDD